jgi:hypothetical protein
MAPKIKIEAKKEVDVFHDYNYLSRSLLNWALAYHS